MLVLRRFVVSLCASRLRQFLPRWPIFASALLAAISAGTAPALAASNSWSSTAASGAWQTAGNWTGGVNVPGATAGTTNIDTATFNNAGNGQTTITTDAGRNLEFITFDTSAAAYTIGTAGGNALLLTSGGMIQIASTFSGTTVTETINAPLTLEGNYTFADNATNAGDLLNFGGAITSGIAGTQALTINGADNTTIGGAVGGGAGTIGLTKNGAGTLILSSNNTFTGGITINQGSLQLANAGALNSTGINPVTFGSSSTGLLSLGGNSVSIASLASSATPGTPVVQNGSAAAATLNINNGGGLTYAGVLQDGAGGGALSLVLNTGTLTLAGSSANTFTGAVTVNDGSLVLGKSSSVQAIGATLNIGDGVGAAGSATVLVTNTSQFPVPLGANVTIKSDGLLNFSGVLASDKIGVLTMTGGTITTSNSGTSGNFILFGDVTTLASSNTATISGTQAFVQIFGATVRTFTVAQGTPANGIDLDISAPLANIGSLGPIVKAGPGVMRLSGNNNGALSLSGGVNLNAGTLIVGNSNALGSGTLTAGGGRLQADGNGPYIISNPVNLSNILTVSGSNNFTLSSQISGSSGLTVNGPGTLTLAGSSANTFTGAVTVNDGSLVLGKSSSVQAIGATLNIGDGVGAAGSATVLVTNTSQFPVPLGANVTIKSDGLLNFSGVLASDKIGVLTMTGGTITTSNSGTSGNFILFGDVTTLASSNTATISGTQAFVQIFGATVRTFTVAQGTPANGIDLDISAPLANIGSLGPIVKAGPGVMRLSGNNNGALSLSGGVNLNPGTLIVGNSNALGSGTLTMAGGTLQADSGSISLNNSVAISAGTSFLAGAQNLTFSGPISGSGGLTKNGLGTLMLSGDSSYSGTLTVAAGTLALNSGTLPATVINQASFVYNGGTFSGQLINQGSTTFNSNSFTAGNGIVNYTTLTASSGFTFTLNGSGLDNEGSFALAGGTLTGSGPLVNGNTLSGNGIVAGSGGFTNNAFLNVSGNLILSNSGPNANIGAINLAAGEFLQLTSGVALTNSGTLNLNEGLVSGAGTLTNSGGSINGPGVISATFNNASGVVLIGNATTLTIVKPWINGGIVQLTSINSNLTGGAITNNGTIQGLGAVSNAVGNNGSIEAIAGTLSLAGATTNATSGTLTIDSASKLVIAGGLATNAGTIVNQGGAFDNNGFPLNNSGIVAGFGTFRSGGLTNNGGMTFTGGLAIIIGPVTNQNGHTITVAYNPALFTGMVTNNGGATFNTLSTTATFAGGFTNNGNSNFAAVGNGSIDVPVVPAFGNASSLAVGGSSTLRFSPVSGAATVGTGVTATVNSAAMLELAGSVSALSSGANRVNVTNNSSAAAGILVSGTNQVVGGIDGLGSTQVNAGSDLTADHIIQSALVIGGAAGSPGLVTIDASDASGNPLGQPSGFALAGSLTPSGPFGAPDMSFASLRTATTDSAALAVVAMGKSVGSGNAAAVPEPSTILLTLLAILGVVSTQFARHHFRSQTV